MLLGTLPIFCLLFISAHAEHRHHHHHHHKAKRAYVPLSRFETVKVPFAINDTRNGPAMEQVYLAYHWDAVVNNDGDDLAVQMTLTSSKPVTLTVDKCGMRVFENMIGASDMSVIWTKEWIESIQTGVHYTCDEMNEFSMNFTIDCYGRCHGKIFFSIIPFKPKKETADLITDRRDTLLFKTSGARIPSSRSMDITPIIATDTKTFLTTEVRASLHFEYSVPYVFTIGKCGLVYFTLEGDKTPKEYIFDWEDVRLVRLAKSTHCEMGGMGNDLEITMRTDLPGHGIFRYHFQRLDVDANTNLTGSLFSLTEMRAGLNRHRLINSSTSFYVLLNAIPLFILLI